MVLAAILLAAVPLPELKVELFPSPGRLLVQMTVQRELPAEWSDALAAGAPVSITYRLRLYRNRHWLWDQRVGAHEQVVKAQRDPLTGVFTLVAELDGEILASGQVAGSRTLRLRRSPCRCAPSRSCCSCARSS
jgi:hypothetical protein